MVRGGAPQEALPAKQVKTGYRIQRAQLRQVARAQLPRAAKAISGRIRKTPRRPMPSDPPAKLFERLTEELVRAIQNGVLSPGERLPSIRQTSQSRKLSITTVRRAYLLLESRGFIESRPQSGYFVRDQSLKVPSLALAMTRPPEGSTEVDVSRLVLATLKSNRSRSAPAFGSPFPAPSLFPTQKLYQCLNAATRRKDQVRMDDGLPPGHPELIRQIARRHLEAGLPVDPTEIVITVGATEAINLCLQAVAKPGDTIAVESPTFYAMLHAIERLGMRAIEVPTHPEEGMDLDWLQHAIERHGIAACMVMPNFQNPLGFKMSDTRKREMVAIAERHAVPLIENGVYNELYYGNSPPTTLKSFDTQGLVLHCSSFSKSLSPTFRIGWALTGRYQQAVEKLKFLNTLTTPSLSQLTVADYLETGGFEQHLRRMRHKLAQNADIMSAMVKRFFPSGTRVSLPRGGYVLWVESGKNLDTMNLFHQAVEEGLTIAPGRMFSNTNMYKRFLRLNYSEPWSVKSDAAIMALGKMAHVLREEGEEGEGRA